MNGQIGRHCGCDLQTKPAGMDALEFRTMAQSRGSAIHGKQYRRAKICSPSQETQLSRDRSSRKDDDVVGLYLIRPNRRSCSAWTKRADSGSGSDAARIADKEGRCGTMTTTTSAADDHSLRAAGDVAREVIGQVL